MALNASLIRISFYSRQHTGRTLFFTSCVNDSHLPIKSFGLEKSRTSVHVRLSEWASVSWHRVLFSLRLQRPRTTDGSQRSHILNPVCRWTPVVVLNPERLGTRQTQRERRQRFIIGSILFPVKKWSEGAIIQALCSRSFVFVALDNQADRFPTDVSALTPIRNQRRYK